MLEFIDRLAGWWIDWRTDQDAKKNPVIQEFNLKRFDQTPGGYEIMAIAPGVAILADQAAELLKANNAENYIQFDMQPRLDRGLAPVCVTVQWARKESPANRAARLEKELVELEGHCAALVAYRDRAGALNFQLEKADDLIDRIRDLIKVKE